MAAVEVVVHGEVQGVFFRDGCREHARATGVCGWVRNDPAGTVTAVFEGDRVAVDSMVEWCRSGTSQARVNDIEISERRQSGFASFEIRD